MPSARRATTPADVGPAELASAVFSTVGLAAPRRVELWEAHNASALIGLDVHAPGPLDAIEVNRDELIQLLVLVPLPRRAPGRGGQRDARQGN